ncbi:LysR family transcriptional regulator [Pusillimonas sp. TS35]|nr:LysR family transcriptional regulator [Pusillimonas sp. TS35]
MSDSDAFLKLNLYALRYFVRAAETGSLSQAALSVGVAQSVLSRHLAQLESLVQGRLFFRTGRGVELTELGKEILPKAVDILHRTGQFIGAAASVKGRPEGLVRIGLPPGICGRLLSKLVPIIMVSYPGVRLCVYETHSGDIEMMLSDGSIDVGLYNRYRSIRDPSKEALYTRQMYLVARRGSSAFAAKNIRFCQLADLPLAMPSRPNSLRSVFDEIAVSKKLSLNVVLELSPGLAMQQVLLNCDVYTILPSHALMDKDVSPLLWRIPITHPAVNQTLYIEGTRHHPLNRAARVVMDHARLLVQQLANEDQEPAVAASH